MAEATIGLEETPPINAAVSKTYRNYALFLLLLIYTVNFLDRQIITSIGEVIKEDMGLTDSQIGALGGIFFAFVYTVLGIPIARWADKGNRPLIMTLSLGVWSGFTVLSGFARTYAVLAIARAGVGIGEAGCSPTAHSLLADYFPKESRARALAIYSMGISLGTLLGFVVGGIVAEEWGWRAAFFVAGAPGLVFAAIALFTLREPRSRLSKEARAKATASNHMSMLMVLSTLEKRPTFWLFALGGALASFVSYSHGQFLLPFFLRNHSPELTVMAAQFGMAPDTGLPPIKFTNVALGIISGFGGALGSFLGGVVADTWGAKNVRNYALFPLLVPFVSLPCLLLMPGTNNMALAFALLIIPNIGVGAWWGPVYGGVQGLVPTSMRALSAAVLLFVINMIGLGAGPTAFGIVTQAMTDVYLAGTGLDSGLCTKAVGAAKAACAVAGAHGIKTAVYISACVIPLTMLCFFLSRFTIQRDTERAEIKAEVPMSTGRLMFYLAVAGAVPGIFLGNASAMFFAERTHMLWKLIWLDGVAVGAAVGAAVGIIAATQIVRTYKSGKTA